MNQSPKREGKYLMKSRIKEAVKAKAKKTTTRKQNIKQGGTCLVNCLICVIILLDWLTLFSESFREGCQGVSR